MDLGLDIIRTTGRASKAVHAVAVRELLPEDLLLLNEERGTKTPALKRLSNRHHALARNLASGMSHGEAALIVGLTNSTVSILLGDPAFKELVEFYQKDVDRVYRDVHQSLAEMSHDAIQLIQERLEDPEKAEKISTGQLLSIASMGADRTGFGPATKSTNVNVNVDLGNRLENARKRVLERQARAEAQTIEGEVLGE